MGPQYCVHTPLDAYSLPLPFSFHPETVTSSTSEREAESPITPLSPSLHYLYCSFHFAITWSVHAPTKVKHTTSFVTCGPISYCLLRTLPLQFTLLSFISSIPFTLPENNSKYSHQMPHRGLLRFCLKRRHIQPWDDTVLCISHPGCFDTVCFDVKQGVLHILLLIVDVLIDLLTQFEGRWYPQQCHSFTSIMIPFLQWEIDEVKAFTRSIGCAWE